MDKKGGLALLIGMGKPKGKPDGPAEELEEGAEEESAGAEDLAADELGEILGVKERDREAFRSALSTYVRACMKEE